MSLPGNAHSVAQTPAGMVVVETEELKVVWRLQPEEVSQVQHPNSITSGPFEFLDKLVQVDFLPKGHQQPYIRISADQKLTLRVSGCGRVHPWHPPFVELARIREDGRSKFQWSGGFHVDPDSRGLTEITLQFGVEKVADPLVKQALQFLERQTKKLNELEPKFQSCQKEAVQREAELRQLRAELEVCRKENLCLRTMQGVGPIGPEQLVRWHQQMNLSTMQSTSYDVVLPFNSLAKFLETRHISLLQKEESELDIGKKQSVRVIAIVGLFEKGKTWLINRLFGINLPSGTLHETDGLSFLWIPERRMLLIDSAGVQSPVSYCAQTGAGNEQSVDDALFDAKSTESFLFDMISRMASHMVFVVNSFTSLEQQYVEMLRRKYVARQVHKELIVVHNMLNVKDAEVAPQLFEKQVTTCYSGDLSTMGQLIFTAKKDKGPPVHHIGLCYESSPAGDAFNDKNRQYLLQSLEHRELETEMVLQDQLREHLSELLKMFVNTEIPEQAAGSERAFGVVFRPGSELMSSAEEKMPSEEKMPKGYVCGGVFSLQLDKGAEPKMRTRGVISPLGELIGYDATFEPNVNVYEETTDAGAQCKILIECPGVAMEDIELDDESLSAGFQLAITKRALIDEQAVRKVDGWPFRQQQGRWERAFLVDLTDGKFEDPVMDLRQDGILEITMKKKQKKGIARLGYKSDRAAPGPAPSESAASFASWNPVSVQGQQQDTEPPLLPHVVKAQLADEYKVFPVHRTRPVRIIATRSRKQTASADPKALDAKPYDELPRQLDAEQVCNHPPSTEAGKKLRNMRFAEEVEENDRPELRSSALRRPSDGAKVPQKNFREGSLMGPTATGRSMRSRAGRSTVLSNALAEIVKERKADELLEEQKAKAYQQEKLDTHMGSKAAEVAKSIGINPGMLDQQRQTVHNWISSSYFDSFIGFIISVNAATIGFEAEVSSKIPAGCSERCICGDPAVVCQAMPLWLKVVDYAFFLIYLVEFLLRVYTYGLKVLKSAWIKFDLFLVLSSMVDITLQQLSTSSEILNQINQIMLVRILRLARLARAVRLMVQFRVLWQLVQGLLHSVSTLLWTFLMVMILVYGFAIVGIETINVDQTLPLDHPYNLAVTENFDGFVDAMFTLFQCFTLDSVSTVYRPLVTHNP
ncbi:unnamed protein product, partial [Symbiodinium sp. CCMP2456]